uniref:Uncharacterized protein n=1 Tax=Globodera pallida TaxID=36090 RepID=A0A183CNM8_GLOPA
MPTNESSSVPRGGPSPQKRIHGQNRRQIPITTKRLINLELVQAGVIVRHRHPRACFGHLLRFIKKKMRTDADENGKRVTMAELMREKNIRLEDISVNSLGVRADRHTFQRFDKFNLKYSPCNTKEEPRLSIYGRAKDEWDKLARLTIGHD